MILSNLATVLILQGKHNETEDILKRKLSLTKQRYGEHWRTSSALEILGVFYFRIKDFKNARAYFKQSNEMYKKALNKYHTWTGISDMYWYLSSKNLTGTDIEPFKETDGYKILDYNRPDFTDYDIIRVEQLLEDALSFSEADLTSETSFLEELLKRKR
jgi:tetratricopeptide (TPR) repeat protein